MWSLGRILIGGLFLVPALHQAQAKSICGSFSRVQGDVKFIEKKGDTQWKAAKVDQSICPGGVVATAANARASLAFSAGEEVHISPESRLVVVALENDAASKKKKSLMNLLNGKVRASVPAGSYKSSDTQFRIRSETAVAGVRGTEFVMSYSEKSKASVVVTLRGQVDVGKPRGQGFNFSNSVLLRAGQQTKSDSVQAPTSPVDLPIEEIKQIDESTQADADLNADTGGAPPVAEPSEEPAPEDSVADSGQTAEVKEPVMGEREPSSDSSMITTEDLGPAPDEGFVRAPDSMVFKDPLLQPLTPPTTCEFCKEQILDGPARLMIKVIHEN